MRIEEIHKDNKVEFIVRGIFVKENNSWKEIVGPMADRLLKVTADPDYKIWINIQVPLPPYKVVFPEDFQEYLREQKYRYYVSMGLNRNISIQHYRHMSHRYPRKDYAMLSHRFMDNTLGPLPQDQASS